MTLRFMLKVILRSYGVRVAYLLVYSRFFAAVQDSLKCFWLDSDKVVMDVALGK